MFVIVARATYTSDNSFIWYGGIVRRGRSFLVFCFGGLRWRTGDIHPLCRGVRWLLIFDLRLLRGLGRFFGTLVERDIMS